MVSFHKKTESDFVDFRTEPRLATDAPVRRRIEARSREFHEFLMSMLLLVHDKRSYEDAVQAITDELSNNLNMQQWAYGNRISDGLLQSGISRFKPVYQTHLDATEVFAWKNCSFAIYWVSPSKQKYKFLMHAPESSRGKAHALSKYVFLRELIYGIMQDGHAWFIREHLDLKVPVAFPIQRLHSCQDTAELGEQLVKLWELETGLDWKTSTALPLLGCHDDTTLVGMHCYPPSFSKEKASILFD